MADVAGPPCWLPGSVGSRTYAKGMPLGPVTDSTNPDVDPRRVLADLSEDRDTAWVPDIIGGADYASVAEACEEASTWEMGCRPLSARTFDVPRPSGATLNAVDLPWPDRLALHDAVSELAAIAEAALDPGVCGYRAGAQAGNGYREEYRRFTEMTDALAESAHSVIIADVRSFFSSVTLADAVSVLARTFGALATARLSALVHRWTKRGQNVLPAGYADARLLANLVLHHVDRRLPMPFTRWVDHYRLFVSRPSDADDALQSLEQSLGALRLTLNTTKLDIRLGGTSWTGDLPLTSVYHPDREGPDPTRAELRRLFAASAADPITGRRDLRFVLPRLARSGDAIAVPFALYALRELPWEAPRAVAYLEGFLGDERVGPAVNVLQEAAARKGDAWMLARLSPLGCRLPITEAAATLLQELLPPETPPVPWAAALRILARQRPTSAVRTAAHSALAPDPRAALAAAHDLGDNLASVPASQEEPRTVRALEGLDEVPTPPAASSL